MQKGDEVIGAIKTLPLLESKPEIFTMISNEDSCAFVVKIPPKTIAIVKNIFFIIVSFICLMM